MKIKTKTIQKSNTTTILNQFTRFPVNTFPSHDIGSTYLIYTY